MHNEGVEKLKIILRHQNSIFFIPKSMLLRESRSVLHLRIDFIGFSAQGS